MCTRLRSSARRSSILLSIPSIGLHDRTKACSPSLARQHDAPMNAVLVDGLRPGRPEKVHAEAGGEHDARE
eukprot:3385181-Prymnesium_polylepis.1